MQSRDRFGRTYRILQNSPGPGNPSAHLVCDGRTGRVLGGVGANFYRPWVFPLYTPAGLTVIQEFPYDHPFHNGIFVGQHPVNAGGRTGNFWAMPLRRSFDDAIQTKVGRMDVQGQPAADVGEEGVCFTFRSIWRDEDEQPLLDETRTIEFRATADATEGGPLPLR